MKNPLDGCKRRFVNMFKRRILADDDKGASLNCKVLLRV